MHNGIEQDPEHEESGSDSNEIDLEEHIVVPFLDSQYVMQVKERCWNFSYKWDHLKDYVCMLPLTHKEVLCLPQSTAPMHPMNPIAWCT